MLSRIVKEIVKDDTTFVGEYIDENTGTIIIRKNASETSFGITVRGSDVQHLFQFAIDNGQVLTDKLKTFMEKCGVHKGARITYDSRSFKNDKSKVWLGLFFRDPSDLFFLEQWDFSHLLDPATVARNGAIKVCFDLNEDRFVTLKIYDGSDQPGVSTVNYTLAIDENDNLTEIETQHCQHFRPATLNEEDLNPHFSERFETEIQDMINFNNQVKDELEQRVWGFYYAFAERLNRTQGYFYITAYSRPKPPKDLNSIFPKPQS